MNNKTTVILLLVLVGVGYFAFNGTKTNSQSKEMLVIHMYDANGNPLANTGQQTFSVVDNVPGVYYISFDVLLNNVGDIPLETVSLSSISPPQFLASLSAQPLTKGPIAVGQQAKWSTQLINITQFEGQNVPFSLSAMASYKSATGQTVSLTKNAVKTVSVLPETCAGGVPWNSCDTNNKPKYCLSGTLVDRASVCGCAAGYAVSGDSCVSVQCTGGTLAGQCTSQQPQYCDMSGNIVNQCATCGCPLDYYGNPMSCLSSGVCEPMTYNPDFTITVNGSGSGSATDASLIGLWHFEGNGDDSSGYGMNAIVGNVTSVSGRIGSAYMYNGLTSGLTIADNNLLDITGNMSVSAWVYPTVQKHSYVLTKQDNYILQLRPITNTTEYRFQMIYYARLSNGSVVQIVTSDPVQNILPNTWYHVAATYQANRTRLQTAFYLNGARVSTQGMTINQTIWPSGILLNTNTNPLKIGKKHMDDSRSFSGIIDEVRLYARTLSDTEVLALYNG